MERLTREEFLADYAKRTGMSALRLTELGAVVEPCECSSPSCKGWKITFHHNDDDQGPTAA